MFVQYMRAGSCKDCFCTFHCLYWMTVLPKSCCMGLVMTMCTVSRHCHWCWLLRMLYWPI